MNIRRGQKFPTYKSETLRNNLVFDTENQNSKKNDRDGRSNKSKKWFLRSKTTVNAAAKKARLKTVSALGEPFLKY